LIEIHKYSEYEVSQCVGNSPKTIRKHYMDLLRADHKSEGEQELARADTDLVGDKSSISLDNTMSHDVPEMVTREEVEQLLEAQKTAVLQGLTVLLRTTPGAMEPFRAAIEEMEKVHHRGVSRTGQDHGKYRVGRMNEVSTGDKTRDVPLDNRPAPPTKAELDELARTIMAYEDTGLLSFSKPTVQPHSPVTVQDELI
jgi:hypothetical protein